MDSYNASFSRLDGSAPMSDQEEEDLYDASEHRDVNEAPLPACWGQCTPSEGDDQNAGWCYSIWWSLSVIVAKRPALMMLVFAAAPVPM